MKILLIDQNYSFTTDIESRMILSDDFETEIITLNNVDETQAKLKMFSPDRIVLPPKSRMMEALHFLKEQQVPIPD